MTTLPVADRATVRSATRRLLAQERRALSGTLVLHAAATLAGLAAPWLLGRIVDEVATGGSQSRVDVIALFIGLSVLAQGALSRTAHLAGHRLGERTVARLRETFVDQTLALPLSTAERTNTGDLATRASMDVVTVGNTIRHAIPVIVISSLQLLLLFGAIFAMHPLLGIISLVGLPAVVMASRWYVRRAPHAYLAEGAAAADLADLLATTAEGARTVEALRLGDDRFRHGTQQIHRVRSTRRATLRLRTVLFPVIDASSTLPVAAVILAGSWFLSAHLVTLGEIVAVALYLQQAIGPQEQILGVIEQAQRGSASFARVLGVGTLPRESAGVVPPTPSRRLVIRGARFAYPGRRRDVLRGVNLEVRPGERLAIVGPSGAGKSTLARLLAGIERPRRGEVLLGDTPISDLDPATRRRLIALVTQEHHVFIGSLRDNLAFVAPEAEDERMASALAAVGADWFVDLPEGLDTAVGAGLRELDASAEQQLALARLLLADPHTLILDEATAAMDPTTARRAEQALAILLQGRTVISIAHRLNTAYDADRVAVLDRGRIAELGTHDELLRARGVYAALWRSWHS